MEIKVKKDDLLKALNHVQSVVERRNTVPILANIKLVAEDNILTLTATDMDIAAIDVIKVECIQPGSTSLPAATLYEIIRKITADVDATITTYAGQSSALLKVDNSEFNLPTLPTDTFPNLEVTGATHSFKVGSEILKSLFAKTRHAISNEETRYYLNGSYLHVVQADNAIPVLRVVATDGHRLARAQTVAPEGSLDMPGVIVPKKAVNELVKLLEDFQGEVEVQISTNRITFIVGTSTLTSRLVDGKYPDYERVIPKANDKTLEVSKDNLARSIDLVISISNDKTRTVKLNLEPSKITIAASSDLNSNARGTQEIPANFDSQEAISIGFNSRYVLDSLSAIDSEKVKMTFSNNTGAVLATDASEENFLYLLMPMQE